MNSCASVHTLPGQGCRAAQGDLVLAHQCSSICGRHLPRWNLAAHVDISIYLTINTLLITLCWRYWFDSCNNDRRFLGSYCSCSDWDLYVTIHHGCRSAFLLNTSMFRSSSHIVSLWHIDCHWRCWVVLCGIRQMEEMGSFLVNHIDRTHVACWLLASICLSISACLTSLHWTLSHDFFLEHWLPPFGLIHIEIGISEPDVMSTFTGFLTQQSPLAFAYISKRLPATSMRVIKRHNVLTVTTMASIWDVTRVICL